MRNALRFAIALAAAVLLLFVVRALAFTIYAIDNDSLSPTLQRGDRVAVSRWSYGLRVGGGKLFPYSRIMPSSVKKGDFIAFSQPSDSLQETSRSKVLIGRVTALPHDTIELGAAFYVLPDGCPHCSWPYNALYMVALAGKEGCMLVNEKQIIGRACLIIYNFRNGGFNNKRWLKAVR